MKVAILYPPLTKDDKYPLLGQNRQFRYSNSDEIRIFPLIPASAATMLSRRGHEVLFLDGINRRLSMEELNSLWMSFEPDLVVIETKAPMLKKHWQFIKEAKASTRAASVPKFVLVGDHVSVYPQESLDGAHVDFCITGGDYDISLVKLADAMEGKGELPLGLYYRGNGRIESTGKFQLADDLDQLPFIDRELTRWQDYGEAYLHRPCAYILSGRGCGGGMKGPGACSFCIWQHALWRCKPRLRSPQNVADEIQILHRRYGVREVFDDNEAGAIWNKEWLGEFHSALTKRDLIGRISISSNARADSLDETACGLLKACGFRLLKVGLESGNEKTLEKLRKGESLSQIVNGVKTAKDFGLIVMLTIMVGYPWETEEGVQATYEAAKELTCYKTRFGDSLQASIAVPYPGTPLYEEARREGWLNIGEKDYEAFDMDSKVLDSPIDTEYWCHKMWKIHMSPRYLMKSTASMRSWQDFKLALRGVTSLLGHLRDYGSEGDAH